MAKSNEHSNFEATELFIIESLLKKSRVIIPDFGHLELKTLGDRRTVFFKPDIGSDSSWQLIPGVVDCISTPLKEEKTVNLPLIGIFRPVKRESNDIHISFTPAAYLRKILNEEHENVVVEPAKDLNEHVEEINKAHTNNTKEIILESQKKSPREEIFKIEHSVKLKTAEPVKNDDIALKPKSSTSNTLKNSQVGDIIVPQDDTYGKRKSRNLSGALWFIVIAITVVVFVVLAILWHKNNNTNEQIEPVSQSESISLPALAEQHYGHPAYWIYIYDANSDKLNSPVNILKSVSIIIPDLKVEYDVDITDSLEIQRAIIYADMFLTRIKNSNNNNTK